MLSSVASLKESLSQIANAVHDDDDEEISIHTPRGQRLENGSPGFERRVSGNFGLFNSPVDSPIINQYKSEIKRLQESEAEIKALSVNYASLLKEKEDLILKLTEENGSLKENISATNGSDPGSKKHVKGSDISSPRDCRATVKTRMVGKEPDNVNVNRNDEFNNGGAPNNGKEFLGSREEMNRSLMIQESYEGRITQLKDELDKERTMLASLQSRLQEEQKCNASLQKELSSLKLSYNNTSSEIQKAYDELNKKIQENASFQIQLQNREEAYGVVENLKKQVAMLEDENRNFKKERVDFEAALKEVRSYSARKVLHGAAALDEQSSSISEASRGDEEMLQHIRKLERDLQESSQERDKALKELSRLKQHLLEKESEESEKMDEDSKVIEELRAVNEQQRTQISRLEQALKRALGSQEEIKASYNNELLKSKESIDELNKKLSGCTNTLKAKNTEIHNLQTALGQYYADMEAKERLVEELSVKKDEIARISKQLKETLQQIEILNKEKEQILERQSEVDSKLAEGKSRVKKVEGDNEKLRRALEQSMTRVNRMSMDSDFLVDRRIVIKLLVTYFQRNHSKEVLDLMVRMLGFSDEDKQRIGIAQQGTGKGLVRGVLGLPGRLVGGMLSSGSSSESSAAVASDNQTFADLWVDFLLKETEREASEGADGQTSSPSQGIPMHRELSSEFSTVPLTSYQSFSSFKPPPR